MEGYDIFAETLNKTVSIFGRNSKKGPASSVAASSRG